MNAQHMLDKILHLLYQDGNCSFLFFLHVTAKCIIHQLNDIQYQGAVRKVANGRDFLFCHFFSCLKLVSPCNVMWHLTPSHHDINKFCVCVMELFFYSYQTCACVLYSRKLKSLVAISNWLVLSYSTLTHALIVKQTHTHSVSPSADVLREKALKIQKAAQILYLKNGRQLHSDWW